MSNDARAVGIVLAAGAGTRYGMPKVLAHQGDWLRSAVAALAGGGCAEVVVVLGAAVVEVPAPARAVVAEDWASGAGASVRAGLAAAGGAALAVLHTVDTPDVGADVVARVLPRAAATGLARAVYGGRPGHPVAVAAPHWPALLDTLRGDEGARRYLAGRDDVVEVECGDLASGLDTDERSREEHVTDERSCEEHVPDER